MTIEQTAARDAVLAIVPDARAWCVGLARRDGSRDVSLIVPQERDARGRITRDELWNVDANGVATLIS